MMMITQNSKTRMINKDKRYHLITNFVPINKIDHTIQFYIINYVAMGYKYLFIQLHPLCPETPSYRKVL